MRLTARAGVLTLHFDESGTRPKREQRKVNNYQEKEKLRRWSVPLIAEKKRSLKYKIKVVKHPKMAEQELKRGQPIQEQRNRESDTLGALIMKATLGPRSSKT